MPDSGDIASDHEQAELQALLAANRELIAAVWRQGKRTEHSLSRTTRGRAKISLDEVGIDLKGSGWALAYFSGDGIEHQGDPNLFEEADSTLLSNGDR